MSQYDYIKEVAKYALANDQSRLEKVLYSLVDYSYKTNKTNFATQLQAIIKESKENTQRETVNRLIPNDMYNNEANGLILQTVMSSFKLDNLICTAQVRKELEYFIKEHRESSLLKSVHIPLTNKIIFYGPSGCGKTLAAYVLAGELEKPLLIVNLGAIVSSKLGETSKNITKIFKQGSFENAIIFLDEFDSIGKIRDYDQDHGEMKRVVNTLLQLFDYLQENAIVIAATNQLQMIDEALKRRFDLALELKCPTEKEIRALVNLTIGDRFKFDNAKIKDQAIKLCIGLSYYVIKRTLLTSIKRSILDKGMTNKIESRKWLELIENEKRNL